MADHQQNGDLKTAIENVSNLDQAREQLRVEGWYYRSTTHDLYFGKAPELVAAGLVRPEQLPGAEGMPTSAVTFYDGQLLAKYQRCKHDEKHLNIARYGSGFQVYVGVTAEVRAEREAIEKQKEELRVKEREAEKFVQEARKDPGVNEEAKLVSECSAVFAVGDQVLVHGVLSEITEGYRLRSTTCEDGEYLSSTGSGKKITYRPGYVYRDTTGDVFFCCAHEIQKRHDKNRVSYLRLVRSQQSESQAQSV
jgi:hypothetical protein